MKMMNYRMYFIFIITCSIFSSEVVLGQSLNEALKSYQRRNYDEAAFNFYDILKSR